MRWRLGLLQDAAAVERQAAKEAAAEAAKKHKHNIPTVKTEAQMKLEEEAAAKAAKDASEPPKPRPRPKIRPLSEAKAIESGATFISETFLFSVAAGLLLFEAWRSRRKDASRRDDVAERLNAKYYVYERKKVIARQKAGGYYHRKFMRRERRKKRSLRESLLVFLRGQLRRKQTLKRKMLWLQTSQGLQRKSWWSPIKCWWKSESRQQKRWRHGIRGRRRAGA